MLEQLRIYLKPPVFPGDEDKTLTASLLHVILWSLLVGICLYTFIATILAFIQPDMLLIAWLYVLALGGLALALMVVMRRGNVRAAAIAVNFGLWIIMTAAAYFNGGVVAPAYSGYLIVIICTSLLVSWQGGLIAATASALAGAVFLLAADNHWLPEWQSQYSLGSVWSANVVYFVVTTMLLALALRASKHAAQQARREIVERLKTEQALSHSEQRFQAIFDSVNDAIFVQDLSDGRILDVNQKMCEMYGYTVEEARRLIVENLSAGYAPYTQHDALAWVQKATSGAPQVFEWRAKARAGRLFWVEVNMRRATIDGQDRLLVVVRDIDERKRAEATLQHEKQFAEDIINSLPGIFCMINQQGELLRWNKLCELVVGYSAAELSGKSILDLFAGDNKNLVAVHIAQAMEEGAADIEAELVTKDGQQLPYYFMGVRTELDDQAYLVGFGIDLSTRKQAEREAFRREAYLRSILDNFPYLVWLKDAAGRFLAVNDVFAKACHQPTAEAVVGKTDLDVWPRELAQKYRADDQSVMDMRTQKSVEEIVAAQGVERWFETYKSPIFDAQGNVIGTAGFAHDITDRKQATEHEQRVSRGLRAVIETAQELINCADLDALHRRSVELAREKLGLERCGLHLLDDQLRCLLGTFGTDERGQTVDERTAHTAIPDPDSFWADTRLWWVQDAIQTYYQGDVRQPVGQGWIAATPIRSRQRIVGMLYNDTAMTHAPVDEAQQEVIAVYGSLLGNLIELKRTEAELAHERDLLQALMDNIPDTIYFKDTASRFTKVNQAQARLLGAATPEDAIGKTDADFFNTELAQLFLAEEQHLMAVGEPILNRMEYNPMHDGQPRWLTASKVPLRDATGQIAGMVGISRDITDRVLAEQREKTISNGLRAVIEAAQELVNCADVDTLYRRSVELARERLGLERCGLHLLDESQQYLLGTFGTDEHGQTTDERQERVSVAERNEVFTVPDRLWTMLDKQFTYWQAGATQALPGAGWIAATPIRSRRQNIGMLYNDTAITSAPLDETQQEVVAVYCSLLGSLIELKRTEAELAHERDLLQALMDNIPDSIYFKDVASRFTRINWSLARVLGLASPEEALGKTDLDFQDRQLAQSFLAEEQELIHTGQPLVDRIEYNPTSDGRSRWLTATKVPLRDAVGQVYGIAGISRDVTDRMLAQQRDQTISQGLRAVIEAADELMSCADLDRLYRRAVELAREKLNVERCGLFTLDEQGWLRGTYGTDLQGQLTDERAAHFQPVNLGSLDVATGQLSRIIQSDHTYWQGDQLHIAGKGWVGVTFIRAHDRVMGVLYNDKAITQAPVDEAEQEVLTVYCSVLGSLIELKRAEEALRASEALYRQAIEAAGAVPYYLDYATESYRFVGAGVQQLTGLAPAEMHPSRWDALLQAVYPLGEAADFSWREAVRETRAGHINVWRVDYYVLTLDGQHRWINDASVQVLDEQGKPRGAIGILQDITDRKQVELALRESESTMRALLDAIPDAIFRFGIDGVFKDYIPPKTLAPLTSPGEFIGRRYDEVMPPDVAQLFAENLQALLRQDEIRIYEYPLHMSGQTAYFEARLVKMAQGDMLGMVRDITDRKRAEAALQQREAYLRAILDNFPYWVWLKDTTGRFLAVNKTMANTYGYTSSEELVGKTDSDIITPELAEKYRADDRAVMASRAQRLTEEIVVEQGTEKWIETFTLPVFDAHGEVIGTAGFAHDVTARRQAEAAIRESEALFRYLADNAPALIALSGEDGVATYLNRAWHAFRGDVPAMPIDAWAEQIHPDDRRRYVHEFRSALQGQRKFTTEYRVRRADGQYRWLLDTIVPRYTADERFAGFIGIAVDITDRKNAEEALRRSESRLRLIADNMVDSISQIDAQQRLTYASPSVERVFGHALRDVLGRSLYEFVQPEDATRLYHHILMAIELGVPSLRLEYRYRHVAGHYLWVESEVRLLYDEHGDFTGAVFGSRDVSGRKQIEIEREDLIKELEDKNAELERFTYTVSHDLKSPLITIRGFLGFLEKDAMTGNLDRLRTDVQRITEATTRMQRLLDELLELSRIGRTSNPPEVVAFGQIVREAVELVQGRIMARGVQVDIADNLPTVYGDHMRLTEVIQNLVDNAIKFIGDQPEPRISIGVLGVERSGMPIFFVQDNGQGIAPEYHERIFGLFNKLDATSEGTGVGLALVKRIIDLHGGHIWVESDGAGHGSTFFFTLPRATPGARQA